MKQVIIAIVAIVAIIGGAVVLGKDKTVTGSVSNHVFGKTDAQVKLIEYGDFECPACGLYYPIIQQVKEKYKDQISFTYRHFPLVQIHRNALAAHRAAEAAGKQGKFWEMYDKLYTNQEDWNGPSQTDPVGVQTADAISIFEGYAQSLGLDVEKYKADVAAAETAATINADTAEGKDTYSVTGTPTFVLNGKKLEGPEIDSVEKLSALIDAALGTDTPTAPNATTETTTPENAQ